MSYRSYRESMNIQHLKNMSLRRSLDMHFQKSHNSFTESVNIELELRHEELTWHYTQKWNDNCRKSRNRGLLGPSSFETLSEYYKYKQRYEHYKNWQIKREVDLTIWAEQARAFWKQQQDPEWQAQEREWQRLKEWNDEAEWSQRAREDERKKVEYEARAKLWKDCGLDEEDKDKKSEWLITIKPSHLVIGALVVGWGITTYFR